MGPPAYWIFQYTPVKGTFFPSLMASNKDLVLPIVGFYLHKSGPEN
jgi:hypothetical protein